MGTSVSNQINLLWISRFGTLKVFDWKPNPWTMHQRAMSLYWICQWICFSVIFLIFSFLANITHHVGKNIICTNKTSLISKNNLWQVWCIWACSSTEETVRTVWKKLISFIQELDVEINWNWLRSSEEERF